MPRLDRWQKRSLGGITAVVLGFAGWTGSQLGRSDPDRSGAPFPIEVVGAVVRPGVVQVLSGATVNDAIQASGGPLKEADLDKLDLTRFLRPGMKVVVGTRQTGAGASRIVGGPRVPPNYSAAPDALPKTPRPVNINKAGATELQFLPEVGEVLANRIILYRKSYGNFSTADQLLNVKGIGKKTLDKMRPYVRLK